MKIKIIAGTMVALSFSLMSCSDFLTEDPRGKLTPENFFSTQDELNMSIYALYQKVNLSQVYTNMQLPQWQGDDITTNPGSNKQPAAEMDKFAAANNNKGVKDAWNMHYAIVNAANLIIQGPLKHIQLKMTKISPSGTLNSGGHTLILPWCDFGDRCR